MHDFHGTAAQHIARAHHQRVAQLSGTLERFGVELIGVARTARPGVRGLEDLDDVLRDTEVLVDILPGHSTTSLVDRARLSVEIATANQKNLQVSVFGPEAWPALESAAREYAEAAGCDVKTMSPERMRLMLSLGALQERHASESRLSIGSRGLQFGGAPAVAARENTTPADIDNFTTQQIAYVRDLAEAWVVPEIATTVPLTGPTGYIHRESATRADSDSAYSAGTALLEGIDPSYSDCPAACGAANGVNLSITPELVEYVCKRLAAVYCYPANFQVSSQYGFSLDGRLNELMREKLQRDVQTEIIDDMVANAGEIILWDATPAGGSYYASANPAEWQATLYNQIVEADSRIVADPQGRVGGATQILADLLTVTRLRKLVPFRIRGDYATAQTLKTGLGLLGIETLETM